MNTKKILTMILALISRSKRARPKIEAAPDVYVAADPASQSIDSVYQATVADGARVVAIVGVESGAGATTVARALASRCSLTGSRTLLIDASGECDDAPVPATRGTVIARDYDRLTLHPLEEDLYRHRSPEFLRDLFNDVYRDYQHIIIDCAPAIERKSDVIPGRLVASSVDAVLLVCVGGRVTSEVAAKAKAMLGDAPLRGVVINGRDQPTVGGEIAREGMRLSRFSPALARRIARWAMGSRFLNVHA
jgi:Mrp family chromosome partitioning ATPase